MPLHEGYKRKKRIRDTVITGVRGAIIKQIRRKTRYRGCFNLRYKNSFPLFYETQETVMMRLAMARVS